MLLLARLICSDEECAELREASVGSLAELDALACDCGCTWELLTVSLDVPDDPRPVVTAFAGLPLAA